jgi:PleD family two-component response regulator
MLVLPECLSENVPVVLSRLTPVELEFGGKNISVSASQGWVQYQSPETLDHLIERADEALYENKKAHHLAVFEYSKA